MISAAYNIVSDTVFRVNSKQKKTKQIIRDECDVSTKNPMRYSLSDFIISSRLLFLAFWTLRLSRAMTILQIMRCNRQIVRQIHTLLYIYTNLNYI